mgnify:CR=1 FL=1|tara:strand:+ start:3024 stop:3365 length:342 start_codon:yes stop_codon:yes gene_type:complete
MARNRRVRIRAKDSITCDIPLDDVVAVPFDRLKEKFTAFAQTHDLDLSKVKISGDRIRGNFTDQSGVNFDINLTAQGQQSKLEGSISKKMDSQSDALRVGDSVRHFTEALFYG